MSTTIATAEPQARPAAVINPLALDEAVARVDRVVDEMIDSAVGTAEGEINRHMRRREVAFAFRGVLRVRQSLDELTAETDGVEDLVAVAIDGERAGLLELYKQLNPALAEDKLAAVVDKFLDSYRERLRASDADADKPRRRARAGKS